MNKSILLLTKDIEHSLNQIKAQSAQLNNNFSHLKFEAVVMENKKLVEKAKTLIRANAQYKQLYEQKSREVNRLLTEIKKLKS